jgi:hypothetical protein
MEMVLCSMVVSIGSRMERAEDEWTKRDAPQEQPSLGIRRDKRNMKNNRTWVDRPTFLMVGLNIDRKKHKHK